ncbi:MAG: CoA pyrophosphatase [Actinomycetota bacterium]
MSESFERRLERALNVRPPARQRQKGARDAAVLIPVVERDEPALIFTVRTDTLSSHKGQISFPGGSIDPGDVNAAHTALREAHEEIDLDPDSVEVVGELDTFPTYVTGYNVTPVVGFLEQRPELKPNPAEVAAVLWVPLSQLDDTIRAEPGFVHRGRTYPTEAWVWNGNVIWGVTARIIRLFLHRLANAGLATSPGPDPWLNWTPPPFSEGGE